MEAKKDNILSNLMIDNISPTTTIEEMSPSSIVSTLSSSPGMMSLPKTIVLTIYNEPDRDVHTLTVLKEVSQVTDTHPEIYSLIELEKDFDSCIMRSRSCYDTRSVGMSSGKALLSSRSFTTSTPTTSSLSSPSFDGSSQAQAQAQLMGEFRCDDEDGNYLLPDDTISVSTGNDNSRHGDDSSSHNDSTDADSIDSSSFLFRRTHTFDSSDDVFLSNVLNNNKLFNRFNRPPVGKDMSARSVSQLMANGDRDYDGISKQKVTDSASVTDEVQDNADPSLCMYSVPVPLLSCKNNSSRQIVHSFEGF